MNQFTYSLVCFECGKRGFFHNENEIRNAGWSLIGMSVNEEEHFAICGCDDKYKPKVKDITPPKRKESLFQEL